MVLTESKTLCNTEITDAKEQAIQREMCRKSFPYFLRYVKTEDIQRGFGIIPFPVDWEYLTRTAEQLQNHRLNVILKSRQMLITWLMAAKVIWRCNFNMSIDYPILSRNEDVSKEIAKRCWTIQDNLPEWMHADAVKTTFEINYPKLRNIVRSMPCTEDAGRSLSTGDFMIDEAAFLKWGSVTYGAIRPIIDKYGNMDVCSTPNLRDGLFFPLWHSQNTEYNKIRLHWTEHPFRDQAWADAMRKDLGESRWMQEYELSFTAVAGKRVHDKFQANQIQPCYGDWSKKYVVIRGWDRGYHHPAVVWTYLNGDDQWCLAKEYMGEDIPRDKFLAEAKMRSEMLFPGAEFVDWVPADFDLTESDGKQWVKIMKDFGMKPKVGKAGKDEVVRRVDAVRRRIGLRDDGKFGLIVDPSCETLIGGFQGAYHYPERIDKAEDEKPVKDGYYDHLQNAIEVIADNHFATYGKPLQRHSYQPQDIEYDAVTGRPL